MVRRRQLQLLLEEIGGFSSKWLALVDDNREQHFHLLSSLSSLLIALHALVDPIGITYVGDPSDLLFTTRSIEHFNPWAVGA